MRDNRRRVALRLIGIVSAFLLSISVGFAVQANDLEQGRAAISTGDYATALRLLAPLAKKGNPEAQNAMGVLYSNGWGVNQDYGQALQWFRKAADQGEPKAQYNLGRMYDQGQGVAKDYGEAVKWYRRSAERGYAQGQSILGAMYAAGDGVPKDYGEAMRWYRKAAEQGDPLAQSRVGFMYVEGQGVSKDYVEAEKWFRKSASQGHPHGQYWLGRLSLEGWGVKKDIEDAVRWWQLAADQEAAETQYELALIYVNGAGKVQKDDVSAIMWLRRSAAHGHEQAHKFLREKYKTTPEEGPALVTLEQVMRASPDGLAGAYLLVSYHVRFIEPARKGAFRATFHTKVDGKAETINESNALIYLAGYTDRLRIYSQAIERHGFQQIAGEYQTKVSPGCERLGFSEGKTVIDQDRFKFNAAHGPFQGEVKHRGIATGTTLVMEHAANPEIRFVGQASRGRIELRFTPAECVITLAAAKGEGVKRDDAEALKSLEATKARGSADAERFVLEQHSARSSTGESISQRGAVDLVSKLAEKVAMKFDDRSWALGFSSEDQGHVISEFVLAGETVHNWTELVTFQVLSGLQVTPKELMVRIKTGILKSCPDVAWTVIRKGKEEIVYEWHATNCLPHGTQHEVSKIIQGKIAMHRVAYTTKRLSTFEEAGQKWKTLIAKAALAGSGH